MTHPLQQAAHFCSAWSRVPCLLVPGPKREAQGLWGWSGFLRGFMARSTPTCTPMPLLSAQSLKIPKDLS